MDEHYQIDDGLSTLAFLNAFGWNEV